MGFLIDTSIWVDIERGRLNPASVANVTGIAPVYLSPVTIAELKHGAEISPVSIRAKRLATLERLKRKPILRIDETTGDIFGSLAATLRLTGRGHAFRIQDLWLASQAIQNALTLLTHNKKDFEDIPGLEIMTMKRD